MFLGERSQIIDTHLNLETKIKKMDLNAKLILDEILRLKKYMKILLIFTIITIGILYMFGQTGPNQYAIYNTKENKKY